MASNLWHECTLFKQGNPSVYLLAERSETFENEDKKIRKCKIGSESASNLTEKVIMFVGETGAGKTTMVNAIANYLLGVSWDDDRRFKVSPDKDEREQTSEVKSKTKWISSYTFHQTKTLPYKVTLIDTPGFGNTGNEDRDYFVTSQVQAFFSTKGEGGIDHIDAVAFVVKASTVRLTKAQLDIFKSVLDLFGKDIRENIFLFITHAEATHILDGHAPVLEAAKAADLPVKGICMCDNNVLFYQKDNRKDELVEHYNKLAETIWKRVRKNLEEFFNELDCCVPKSISLTVEVLEERRNLEIIVESLPDLITSCIVEMNRARKEEEAMEKYRERMRNNQNFDYEIEEEQVKETPLEAGKEATVCTHCKRTCHFPCKRDLFIKIGGVKRCAAMRLFPTFRGCGVCLKHCAASYHELWKIKYEREIVRVTKTNEDVKERYHIAKENMNNAEYVISVIRQNQVESQQNIDSCITRLREGLERLNKIALKSDPSALVRALEALKEKQIRKMEPGWKERVEELDKICKRERERLTPQTAQQSDHYYTVNTVTSKLKAITNWKPGGKKDNKANEKSDNDDGSYRC